MSDEDKSGAEIDPYRLEAMRLAVQWTDVDKTFTDELIECAAAIEAYLRAGTTS